ncbi:768_t:CDS:2 [Gigaspora rosea]|nr:768_t:CDS:2 [Gigaspora rosea]
MSSKDLTKLFYYGSNHESIESFMSDYEGYVAMKDWDDAKKRLVIGLYIAQPLRDWVRNIVETKNTWAEVKANILTSAKAKYHTKEKIEYLMNIKQKDDESVLSYANRFAACANKEKYPEIYEETEEWAIKIEKFEKSDEFDLKKASIIREETIAQTNTDVDELSNAFSGLKICRVNQSNQDMKDMNRIDKLESKITKLTKESACSKSPYKRLFAE